MKLAQLVVEMIEATTNGTVFFGNVAEPSSRGPGWVDCYTYEPPEACDADIAAVAAWLRRVDKENGEVEIRFFSSGGLVEYDPDKAVEENPDETP